MKIAALTALALSFAAPVLALGPAPATASAEPAADACLDSETEAALATCRSRAVRAQMAQIGRLDAVLLKRARGEPLHQKALQAAATAWLRYRDAECRATTWESRTGTAGGTYLLYCQQQLNAARIADLNERVSAP